MCYPTTWNAPQSAFMGRKFICKQEPTTAKRKCGSTVSSMLAFDVGFPSPYLASETQQRRKGLGAMVGLPSFPGSTPQHGVDKSWGVEPGNEGFIQVFLVGAGKTCDA